MEFRLVDGKMVQVDKSVGVATYTWTMPKDNLVSMPKRNIMDVPMQPIKEGRKNKGVYARSSMIAGLSSVSLMAINPENGIFWEIFMEYIYPWFLDISQVYVAIKIAQAFYQENRSGSSSSGSTGIGAVIVHGKWLLLFHMIPFFVKLIDEMGKRMMNELG